MNIEQGGEIESKAAGGSITAGRPRSVIDNKLERRIIPVTPHFPSMVYADSDRTEGPITVSIEDAFRRLVLVGLDDNVRELRACACNGDEVIGI